MLREKKYRGSRSSASAPRRAAGVVASTLGAVALSLGALAGTASAAPAGDISELDAPQILLQEDFESGSVQQAPAGWTVESSETAAGMQEGWQGWVFHSLSDVKDKWGADGNRGDFTRSEGKLAGVYSDGNRPSTDTSVRFDSTLWSPELSLPGDEGTLEVSFDSSYRAGQAPQEAKLLVSFDGEAPEVLEEFTGNRVNEAFSKTVALPTGVTTAKIGWAYLVSANNWYWMVDNVAVQYSAVIQPPATPAGIDESFSDAPAFGFPEGWSVDSTDSVSGMQQNWQGWTTASVVDIAAKWGQSGKHNQFNKGTGPVAIVQSDGNRPGDPGKFSSTLWSPEMPIEEGLGAVKLTFDTQYRQGQSPQTAFVLASFDGGEPVKLKAFDSDKYNETIELSVDVPHGSQSVKFGWAYLDSANNWYWMIDNVRAIETEPGPVTPEFITAKKPVAHPGDILTVSIAGLREGMQAEATFAGQLGQIPVANAEGTTSFDITIPADADPALLPLTISGENIVEISQAITVLTGEVAPYSSLEPRYWTSTLESFEGWTVEGGWEALNVDEVTGQYGLDGRQQFTRGDHNYAHVEAGSEPSTLVTPTIDLTGADLTNLELRADIHLRVRGTDLQEATIEAVFPGQDAAQVLWSGTGKSISSAQLRLPVEAPRGATSVQFQITYSAPGGNGSLSLDNLYLTRPLAELAGDAAPQAVVDVFSDIQGSTARMCENVMPGLEQVGPTADTLVMVGDLVANGSSGLYDTYFSALNGCGVDRYDNSISVIGNHEYYGSAGTPQEKLDLFLNKTGMGPNNIGGQGGLWGEIVVDDELPVLWIGSEYYNYSEHTGSGPFMEMSDTQFEWLQDRLDHWDEQEKPVVLFAHYVFPYSLSATYINFNRNDYGEDTARIMALLQQHPNVTMVTAHTHWDIALHDWTAEKRFEPNAEYGITMFNSGAVTTQYGPSGDWGEARIDGIDPTGLKLSLFEDRLRVDAYRFAQGGNETLVQTMDVPLPGEPAPPAPVDVTVEISGDVVEGETLSAVVEESVSVPLEYTWYRAADGESEGTVIAGAEGASYVLTGDDVGAYIWVSVTGEGVEGTSDRVGPVREVEEETPADITVEIVGDVVEGETLTAVVTGAEGVDVAFQWYRSAVDPLVMRAVGSPIEGATSGQYVLTEGDVGQYVGVEVVSGGQSVVAWTSGVVQEAADGPGGEEQSGGDQSGGEQSGGEQSGGEQSGGDKTGGSEPLPKTGLQVSLFAVLAFAALGVGITVRRYAK